MYSEVFAFLIEFIKVPLPVLCFICIKTCSPSSGLLFEVKAGQETVCGVLKIITQ